MQRGLVITLAASENNIFERVARSAMLENASGDFRSVACSAPDVYEMLPTAMRPAASARFRTKLRIAMGPSPRSEIETQTRWIGSSEGSLAGFGLSRAPS